MIKNLHPFKPYFVIGLTFIIILCFQACNDDDDCTIIHSSQQEMLHLKGTVLDSLVFDAFIRFFKTNGDIIATGDGDSRSTYDVSLPESTAFPVHIEMTQGEDFITKEPLSVTFTSYALNYYQEIANITPLTHLIRLTAIEKENTTLLTSKTIEQAIETVMDNFGFTLSSDCNPVTMKISGDDAADALVSSQLVAELIKSIAGKNKEDQRLLCHIWAQDLSDNKLDGKKNNQVITTLLSNGLNGVKVCILTHFYRIILSCDLLCNSYVFLNNDGEKINNSDQLVNALNILFNGQLSLENAQSRIQSLSLSSVFMVELIKSMNIIKRLMGEALPSVYSELSDALDKIQTGADVDILTDSFARSIRSDAVYGFIINEIRITDTNTLATIIHNPLKDIQIIYPYQSVQENSIFKLFVSGQYQDGTTTDLSSLVSWTSSPASSVVINNKNNSFIAAGSGTVTITAGYKEINDSVTLEIVPYHPSLISFHPQSNSNNVPLNTLIKMQLSKDIACSSVTTQSFTITNHSQHIEYSIFECSGKEISLSPTVSLNENTTYTVTVSTDLRDKNGHPLQESYMWSFSSAHVPPVITSKCPNDGVTSVSLASPITVSFSEPIDYTSKNILFTVSSNANNITGIFHWNSTSDVLVFQPTQALNPSSTYSITVNASDFAGNPMTQNACWHFETEMGRPRVLSHFPISDQVDVPVSLTITVTFSEPVRITNNLISLKSIDGSPISGTISSSQPDNLTNCIDCLVKYTLPELLTKNTQYIATITSALTDKSGVPMESPYTWTFFTQKFPEIDAIPSFLQTNDPVCLTKANEEMIFVFSEPMALTSYTLTISNESQLYTLTIQSNSQSITYGLSEPFGFTESTAYTLTLANTLEDQSGHPLKEETLSWSFKTKGIPPTVIQTVPENHSEIDQGTKKIEIVFSESIMKSSSQSNLIAVHDNTMALNGTVTIKNNRLCYTLLNELPQDSDYTVTIYADSIQDSKGNPLQKDYTFSFSTKNILPGIQDDYYPQNNAIVTATNTNICFTSTEAVSISDNAAFSLIDSGSNTIEGNWLDSIDNNTYCYKPQLLEADMAYTVTIGKGLIQDAASEPNECTKIWHFATFINTLDYTFTATTEQIAFTFTTQVDPKSFTHSSFYLSNEKGKIACDITKDAAKSLYILSPKDVLPGGETYTVTITTGIKNINGRSLSHNICETFSLLFENYLNMEFAFIPAGSFFMGSPIDEMGRDIDENQYKVTISKPFLMQTTEVTQEQWTQVMGENPSFTQTDPSLPVENVSWNDVQAFIHLLNEKDTRHTYMLPTEAQWEYAARATTETAFSNGTNISQIKISCEQTIIDDIAYYCFNSQGKTHPVSQKQANAWHLYDMLGNVMEWTADYYLKNYQTEYNVDPVGPQSGSLKVIRGGSFADTALQCRSANRGSLEPDAKLMTLGFRLIKSID